MIKGLQPQCLHPLTAASCETEIPARRETFRGESTALSLAKMIGQTFTSISPAYIAGAAAVVLIVLQVWIRVRYALKVRAAGGVHAPTIAKDPFTGEPLHDSNFTILQL